MLKNKEIETELFTYLKPLYEYGLDAVIVQDYGVFQFIYRNFPGLALHASTQMSVANVAGSEILDGSWRRADRYSQRTFQCGNPGVFMMKRVWRLRALFTGIGAIVIPDSV